MLIHELHIGSLVMHTDEMVVVAALSSTGMVITQNIQTKKFNPKIDARSLGGVKLTKELFKKLHFTIHESHFERDKIWVSKVIR